jgi:hypothetical protein
MNDSVHVSEPVESVEGESRRHFLGQLLALCIGVLLVPVRSASATDVDSAARAAAQWARIRRNLPADAIAGYEQVANKLARRMPALLKDSKWEGKTYKAIADELKLAGIYPERNSDDSDKEADRLRGQAQDAKSKPNAVGASTTSAAAVCATIPTVGPIIAAVLLAIAAVLILIGQIIGNPEKTAKEPTKAQKSEADQKEDLKKILKAQIRLVEIMETLDDCVLFGLHCKK